MDSEGTRPSVVPYKTIGSLKNPGNLLLKVDTVTIHCPDVSSARTGAVSSCSLRATQKRREAARWKYPEAERCLPRGRDGKMSVSEHISSTSLCIFLSRESLPLWPLMASTTISPAALPVVGRGARCALERERSVYGVKTAANHVAHGALRRIDN